MLRNFSVCILALVAVLLFSSDANACRRSRASCCGSWYYASYDCCGGGYGSGSGSGAVSGSGNGSGAGYGYGGRRAYNPGGIGGPASGLGVRPGLGVGGAGRGR